MSTRKVHTSEQRSARQGGSEKLAVLTSQVPGTSNSPAMQEAALIDSDQREDMIRKAAYFRAASRGFCPGQEVEDWLAAEREVDRRSANGEGS